MLFSVSSSKFSEGTELFALTSIFQPVSLAASLTFWPDLPIAKLNLSSGTTGQILYVDCGCHAVYASIEEMDLISKNIEA